MPPPGTSPPSCSVDPLAKKVWYDIKAPSVFSVRNIGKTLVSRTQGTKVHQSLLSIDQWERELLLPQFLVVI
ncbi:unnamed protein product [Urochloa humidicola]